MLPPRAHALYLLPWAGYEGSLDAPFVPDERTHRTDVVAVSTSHALAHAPCVNHSAVGDSQDAHAIHSRQ
ncbi:hypothetical protein GCM10022199_26920 [Marihabitans asiaticum]